MKGNYVMRKTVQSVFLAFVIASLMLTLGSVAWAKEGNAPPGQKKHHHKHHHMHHHGDAQGDEKK